MTAFLLGCVIQLRADREGGIVLSRLYRQSALPRRGTDLRGIEDFGDLTIKTQAMHTGGRQHNRVILAFLQLAYPRIYIAADRLQIKIGPQPSQLCRTPS